MRIAIVNVTGTEGSTGKIATNLSRIYTEMGHQCRIYYGRGKMETGEGYRKYSRYYGAVIHYLLQRFTDKEGFYSSISTRRLVKDITEYNPCHVILLNLHGHYLNIPMFMKNLAQLDTSISYFMCDEFPYTARCTYTGNCTGYKTECKLCKEGYKHLTEQYLAKEHYYHSMQGRIEFSSVEYIAKKARESSLLRGMRIEINNTGINTDFYRPLDSTAYLLKLGIDVNKIILLDVAGYSNERKGVKFFLEAARKLESDDKYIFINVGYDGRMESLPKNYIAIPYVSNQEELRTIYSLADRYICTSVDDALPNACVEAMSCGTPIVAFNISGMPYIAKPPILTLVTDVNADALATTIKSITKKNRDLMECCREYAECNYSFAKFAERLLPPAN